MNVLSDEERKARKKARAIAYRAIPEVRSKIKARKKEYAKRPEVIEKRKEKSRTPEARAKRIEYDSKPEVIAKQRENTKRPEVKAKRKASQNKYRAKPESKLKFSEYAKRPESKARQKVRRAKPEVKVKIASYEKERRETLKKDIFSHYSKIHSNSDIPCCRCCGLNSHIEFLTLDHIAGRKEMDSEPELLKLGYSSKLATQPLQIWIKKNNFPEGFQVLCINCNFAKGHSKDNTCPHERD